MAITFDCACGKTLRAKDELAGRKARCTGCGAVMTIPAPEPEEPDFDTYDTVGSRYEPEPEETPAAPSAYSSFPASKPKPKARAAETYDEVESSGGSSIREYAHLLLAFALIPLVVSLLGEEAKEDIQDRFAKTIARATPEEQKRIEGALKGQEISLDEAFAVLPGGKLEGAHLPRNTTVHWVYAGITAVAALLLLGLCFSVERAKPAHLLGIGAFTGTVGIIFLLLVQLCSNFRLRGIRGRGLILIIMLILTFIGWSYDSANDPESNFLLSALGFTFGVGLCEEFTKAIPLFFYFKRDGSMGWRGACLWGLASGIGFGVSEGIMYSSRYYNGMSGPGIYLVRFISCVALHAMWSGSVGIAIARNVEEYEGVEDAGGFGLFMLKVMAVPMTLHGFYDTLLKKDMNVWALAVALVTFGWFAWHVELARGAHPGAGRPEYASKRRRPAY